MNTISNLEKKIFFLIIFISLFFVNFVTGFPAQGENYSVNEVNTGLQGSVVEGEEYTARSLLDYKGGSSGNARSESFFVNIGFLGNFTGYVQEALEIIVPNLFCGDNIKNNNEECDGSDFGAESCRSQGFSRGDLDCSSSCKILTSSCSKGDGGFYVEKEELIEEEIIEVDFSLEKDFVFSLNELKILTTFENVLNKSLLVNTTFIILDSNENEVYVLEEQINITKKIISIKSFEDIDLDIGKYKLVLKLSYGEDVKEEFSTSFEIIEKVLTEPAKKSKLVIVLIVFALIGFMFWLIKNKKTSKYLRRFAIKLVDGAEFIYKRIKYRKHYNRRFFK
ncbi:hypothetical protein ACFLZF_00410 [Nanoarchaeota archaeon]